MLLGVAQKNVLVARIERYNAKKTKAAPEVVDLTEATDAAALIQIASFFTPRKAAFNELRKATGKRKAPGSTPAFSPCAKKKSKHGFLLQLTPGYISEMRRVLSTHF